MTLALPPDPQRRFGGLARLYGTDGAQKLHAAHVVVVGLGGVGSWAAEALARSGVGALTLVDMDHVAESNINRQIQALDATLGQAKVEAMRARIAAIHPGCRVQCVDDFVTPQNWPALLPANAAAVIDACDQVSAKVAMAAAHMRQRPAAPLLVSVGAAGGKWQAQRVEVADLATVSHDRLLARLRQQLRSRHAAPRHGRMGVPCVFSREETRRPGAGCCAIAPGAHLNCHGYGSSVAVTATFGLCAAGWVMERIAQGR